MKKLFAIFAAALVAFGMTSCKDKNAPEPEKKEGFTIEVSNITAKAATITVTPGNDTVSYYNRVMPKRTFDQACEGDEAKLLENFQRSAKEEYQHAGSIGGWVKGGAHTYVRDDLFPETEFLAIVVPMDKEGNIPVGAKMYSKAFTTEKATATIEIRIDGVISDAVYYNIIPSDLKTRIFFNVVVQAVADGREDKDLIAEAKEMSDEELNDHVWTGEVRNAVRSGLVPNVNYVMYAFYFDENKNVPAGTKVVRANFKTDAE